VSYVPVLSRPTSSYSVTTGSRGYPSFSSLLSLGSSGAYARLPVYEHATFNLSFILGNDG
jgi:hypothetical protein